ncbi:MAG: recombinase family protein [Deltaproteobacteria bacterium]|nr:recombinase family protein [Deltaproteobacteria bacterium]
MIGYVRVSTEDQAQHGVSLAAQRERLAAHASAHGYDLIGVEGDEGVSGKVDPRKRPGLSRALALVRDGGADGLVFLKLDRLSRSVRDILKLADEAKRRGWHIASVHEHIDTSTASGKFTLGVLALLAEMERDQISERTTMGMQQVAREGRARSRFLPFGHRIEGEPDATTLSSGERRPLVEHAEEMAILRRMIDLKSAGLGAQRIAKTLNAEGTLNPRTGREWTTPNVAGLLRTRLNRRTGS